MASRKRTNTKTIMTFAVTFVVPDGRTISELRQDILDGLVGTMDIDKDTLKISLTNKEVQYAKR